MLKPLAVVGAATALFAAACGSDEDAADVVEIRGNEYAYALPAVVEGGWQTIRFTNAGSEQHDAIILRFEQGRTVAELQKYMKGPQASNGPPPWVTLHASVGTIAAGEAVEVTQRLVPGAYVVVCSAPGPDGVPHFRRGMLRGFEVAGATDTGPPEADVTINLRGQIQAPDLEEGEQTIEFRNDGKTGGGAIIYALEPGKSAADVKRWIASGSGPAPARYVAGDVVAADTTVFYTADFEAGRSYVIVNEATGAMKEFRVS